MDRTYGQKPNGERLLNERSEPATMGSLKRVVEEMRHVASTTDDGDEAERIGGWADRIESLMSQSDTVTVINVGGQDTVIPTGDAESAKASGYEPRTFYAAPQDCDEVRRESAMLGELLATIHQDGGHNQEEFGSVKSFAVAMDTVYMLRAQLESEKRGADAERKHSEILRERLRRVEEELERDAERLDFIERMARKSPTGASFDWAPSVEGEPSGYRMMWRHTLNDRAKDIRAAVDRAMLNAAPEAEK